MNTDDELNALEEKEKSLREEERVSSDILPLVMKAVGGLAVFAGAAALSIGVMRGQVYLLGPAVYALVSAPFLYGFADIVISLRRLCRK